MNTARLSNSIMPSVEFLTAWRKHSSSVIAIATADAGNRYVMLATSICSVSAYPPSLLICVDQSASIHAHINRRGAFTINVLAAEDRDLANHISTNSGCERFTQGKWQEIQSADENIDGLPWLSTAQSSIACRVKLSSAYGTHTIFIGNVSMILGGNPEVDPLCYCNGSYQKLTRIETHVS